MMELKMANGKFVGINGANVVKSFSDSRVVCDGWIVKVTEDFAIDAVASDVGGAKAEIFISPAGQVITTNSAGEKKFALPRKILELRGTLCFTTGPVAKRRMFFKSRAQENFMKKHQITSYKYQVPNRFFEIDESHQQLFTDGSVEEVAGKLSVNDATWVIIYNDTGEKVLYSTEHLKSLVLPKFLKEGTEEQYVRSLKRNFRTREEAVKYVKWRFDFDSLYENTENLPVLSEKEEIFASYWYEEGGLKVRLYKNSYWKEKDNLPKGVKIFYDQKKGRFCHGELLLDGSVWIATV